MIKSSSKVQLKAVTKGDYWLFRIGLCVGSIALVLSLVSQSLFPPAILMLGTALSLYGQRHGVASLVNHMDGKYGEFAGYRILRWTLRAVLYCAALIVGAIFGLITAETRANRRHSGMADMVEPNVDAIWESDPARYYEKQAPGPFDR